MIDPEKIPDVPNAAIAYAGAELGSRYGKRRELDAMMSAFDFVLDRDAEVADLIVEMFCDSKAGAAYSVKCCHPGPPHECSTAEIETLATLLDHAFRQIGGGHNSILIESGNAETCADPWWAGDAEESTR